MNKELIFRSIQSKWRNLDPVWRWNTRKARKLFKKNYNPEILDYGFYGLLKNLHKYGIAMNAVFLEVKDNFQSFLNYKNSVIEKHINSLKPFLIEYWPSRGELDLDNPFVKLALSPVVLDIVSRYLGCWPRLYDLRLWESKPMTPGHKRIYSQSWHRDPEDKKLLNMFVYLSDVDEESGPFHYVPGSHIEGPYCKTFPQVLPPRAAYYGDEAVEKVFKDNILKCTGKAGTIIFADTAGLHRGSSDNIKPRIMFKALYVTDGNFGNKKTRYSLSQFIMDENLTEQQKYAIGIL